MRCSPAWSPQIRDPQGRVIKDFPARDIRAADLEPQTRTPAKHDGQRRASRDRYAAADPGVVVAGKTGTATTGPGPPPTRGSSPSRRPPTDDTRRSRSRLSCLDGGSLGNEATGGRVAAPIADQVIACLHGGAEGRGDGLNGSVLGGRYRVEARIGSRWDGRGLPRLDTVLDRTVAIKVLLPQFARDVSFVDRFRREAQAAARLNHPNLVGIYDSGADGETQFLVMEFIQGRTLEDFLSSGGRLAVVHAVEWRRRSAARSPTRTAPE